MVLLKEAFPRRSTKWYLADEESRDQSGNTVLFVRTMKLNRLAEPIEKVSMLQTILVSFWSSLLDTLGALVTANIWTSLTKLADAIIHYSRNFLSDLRFHDDVQTHLANFHHILRIIYILNQNLINSRRKFLCLFDEIRTTEHFNQKHDRETQVLKRWRLKSFVFCEFDFFNYWCCIIAFIKHSARRFLYCW